MRKALVVGLNQYPKHNLSWCSNDAESIARLLEKNEDESRNFDVLKIVDSCDAGSLRNAIQRLFSDTTEITLKQRKYVVIATHNANIAVRTLPYTSIFRTHENGEYKTYVGNPFDDKLTNLADKDDIRSWTDESMHSLEGSKEAFYERRDIYESKSN